MNFLLGGGAVTNDVDQTVAVPSWQPVRTGASNVDPLSQLGIGDTVNSASTSATGFGASGDPNSHFPEFTPYTPGYVGFSLVLEDNTTAYGWMRVTLQENNQSGGLIHEWVIEDSGDAITVGVPEPNTSLLAILALDGIFLRRRRWGLSGTTHKQAFAAHPGGWCYEANWASEPFRKLPHSLIVIDNQLEVIGNLRG